MYQDTNLFIFYYLLINGLALEYEAVFVPNLTFFRVLSRSNEKKSRSNERSNERLSRSNEKLSRSNEKVSRSF